MAALSAKTSLIEWKNLRFLIMDAPKDTNLHLYLKECKKNNVTQIVRISEPSYSKDEVEKAGICLNVSELSLKLLFISRCFIIICPSNISSLFLTP